MKTTPTVTRAVIAAAILTAAHADTWTWLPSAAEFSDRSGPWNTSTSAWVTPNGATAIWDNAELRSADFGDMAESFITVSDIVADTVTINALNFLTSSGGSLTLNRLEITPYSNPFGFDFLSILSEGSGFDVSLAAANALDFGSGATAQALRLSAFANLSADATDAINFSAGRIDVTENAAVTANASGSISGGTINVNAGSDQTARLNVTAADGITGGRQTFEGSAVLNAQSTRSVAGGRQNFEDSSSLIASAEDSVVDGTQTFLGSSTLDVRSADGISGGEQEFDGTSQLLVSESNGVTGGFQTFINDSSATLTASRALSGGTQTFADNTFLNSNVDNALDGSNAVFGGNSTLNVNSRSALGSGVQFIESATLNLNAADIYNALGSFGIFSDQVTVSVNAAAISFGNFIFSEQAALRITVANGISSAFISLDDDATFTSSVTDSVIAGQLGASGNSLIAAGATNAIASSNLSLGENARLVTTAANALSTNTNVNLANQATFEMSGFSQSVASLSSTANGGIVRNGSNADVTLTVKSGNFGGRIEDGGTGSVSLVKTTASTLTLGGNSTYTGTTTVEAGTLMINGTTSNQANLTVDAGATLGGTGEIGLQDFGVAVIRGTLAPGESLGTLTIGAQGADNTIALADQGRLEIELGGNGQSDVLAVIGNLNLNSDADQLVFSLSGVTEASGDYVFLTYTGTLFGEFSDVQGLPDGYALRYDLPNAIALTAVPEPAAFGLFALAATVLLLARRRW